MKTFAVTLLFLIMTTLMIWCAGFLWFSTAATTEPSTINVPKADAIVVLTGGKGRIDEGFYLFATKRAPKLFISGVNKNVGVDTLVNNWEGAPLPDCCIDVGYTATNTMGNALESANWLKNNEIKTVFLVTSNYHMPRSLLEFSFAAPEAAVYPHPVFADREEKSGYEYTKLLIGEYHKTILTYLRHVFTPKDP